MQTADLIFVSISGLVIVVYNFTVAYFDHLAVKWPVKNSREDELETLHGPVRPYLFEPTAKPGAEWINLIYLCHNIMQKLVLSLFNNMNFKFVFLRAQTLQ